MGSRKRILNPFEWLILLIAILLVLYIIRPDGKFTIFERSETVKFLDKPTNSQSPPGPRKNVYDSDQLRQEEVNSTLQNLAIQYANGNMQSGIPATGLSSGEQHYLEAVKKSHGLDGQLKSAKEWYRLLKKSHDTYSSLKSIMSEASGEAGAELEEKPLEKLFRDSETANGIYDQLYELYHISRTKSGNFAQSGPKTLSDWADFVSDNAK